MTEDARAALAQVKRRPRTLPNKPALYWATLRDGETMPCLWGSLRDANANCDLDEQVVRVQVEFVYAGSIR